jgi:hypothetical protein
MKEQKEERNEREKNKLSAETCPLICDKCKNKTTFLDLQIICY